MVKLKYSSIVDTPEVVLAKTNAENISIVSHFPPYFKIVSVINK